METAASTSSSPHSRPNYACVRCSDRKVKCDRQTPCSACVKHNVQCFFRPPRPPRRHKRTQENAIYDRLKRYEELLREKGIEPNALPDNPKHEREHEQHRPSSSEPAISEYTLQLPTPASTTSEIERPLAKAQLVHGQGRSKFVDNILWRRVVEEFQDPQEALEESTSAYESDEDLGFVVGVVGPHAGTKLLHPSATHVAQLWDLFVENVNPLTRIVHVPTLQIAIEKAAAETEKIPQNFEALLFAIYSAAIMSLKDDECIRIFEVSRKSLLSRYTLGTKEALSRAKFMGTTSIVVLQALVLHLLSVRDLYEPRALYSLSGISVRVAETMGLQRDGTKLGLSPFETEIRRRIWWQLKMNDYRTAELCGLAKFKGIDFDFSTSILPANVNDSDLHPGMSAAPAERSEATDMVFCRLRAELGSIAAKRTMRLRGEGKLGGPLDDFAFDKDMGAKDKFIQESVEVLETKYLRYCDPAQPLQLMTMLAGRVALDVGRFMAHHPRSWGSQEQMPESERQYVWDVSIRLLEKYDMMQTHRQLQRFAWHAAYFFQWHAYIHVLDTLRANPLMADAARVWQLVESVCEHMPGLVSNTKKTIHRAVGNLCLKAFDVREAALVKEGRSAPPAPGFITQLREQREASRQKDPPRGAKGQETTIASVPPSSGGYPEPSQHSLNQMMSLDQPNDAINDDTSWMMDFDFGLPGISSDPMDMDIDFMLAQDFTPGGTASQTIDWTQWDAWMGR